MCARSRSEGAPELAMRSRTARASANFPRNICVSARRASSRESCGTRSNAASRSPARALSANAGPTSISRATAASRSPDSIRWYAASRRACRPAQDECARTWAARGEELEGERVSPGRGDDPRDVRWFERGPPGGEQFRSGIIVEAFEAEFEDASPRDVGWLEERRLRAARNEDFRIRRMFEDRSEEGVGGGARMEIIDREDTAGQVFPEDGDDLDRVVGGTRDGRLQPPAILMREEVRERTQEAVRVVVGVHAAKEFRPAFPGEGPGEERGPADPRDADHDGDGPRPGGKPLLQEAAFVRPAEERAARDRGRLRRFRSGRSRSGLRRSAAAMPSWVVSTGHSYESA